MNTATTQRKYPAKASRFTSIPKRETSWRFLKQKLCAMASNQASPKELSEVIITNQQFAEIVVRRAGCTPTYAIDKAIIIHAILLLGVDRLCELVAAMS